MVALWHRILISLERVGAACARSPEAWACDDSVASYVDIHYTYLSARAYTTIQYITLRCIALHCIALHCIALHCIALYYVILYYIILYYIILYYTTFTKVANAATVATATAAGSGGGGGARRGPDFERMHREVRGGFDVMSMLTSSTSLEGVDRVIYMSPRGEPRGAKQMASSSRPHYIILHYITSHYIILYYIILSYAILHYIILYVIYIYLLLLFNYEAPSVLPHCIILHYISYEAPSMLPPGAARRWRRGTK